MTRLPVVVGFGGFNPAGRVSSHHSYCRTVVEALSQSQQARTYQSLATLMGIEDDVAETSTQSYIRDHTLIRRIELFDPDRIPVHGRADIQPSGNEPLTFSISAKQLPVELPEGWQVTLTDNGRANVQINASARFYFADQRTSRVTSAGQLPTGFDPSALYASRNHPRGLQLAVVGASDAIRSVGIDWRELYNCVRPDEVAVFAGSAMGQMDSTGYAGLLQAPYLAKRPSSKQAALGLSEMPADFVNAYVSGTMGATGGVIGACATFLYNVKQGLDEIRFRGKRIAIVGGTEAPITPELVEAYRTMGALAEDEALMAIDDADTIDNRRACRPFSTNAGFTLAEAGVYVVLMDDELALEVGAEIYGAIADVFTNADGYKKSIPGPGIGNYITMGQSLGLARSILGARAVSEHSFIHAHGTGTPQNRVTESHILNEMAKNFGMTKWPVAAIKAYLGHTLAPASGDQITSALGTWQYGIIPGIATIDHVADDVHASHLRLEPNHLEIDPAAMSVAFVNSKGFGGNNATGVVLSPLATNRMLEKRHGKAAMKAHRAKNEGVRQQAEDYDASCLRQTPNAIYRFGEGVISGEELGIQDDVLRVPGFDKQILLTVANPYADMS